MDNSKLSNKQWITLVEKARIGDELAFEELCRRKVTGIIFVCYNILNDWQEAEDAAQEVLMAMKKNLSMLSSPEAFPSWLNRVSFNVSCTMRRKKMKTQYMFSIDEDGLDIQDYSIEALPEELLESDDSRQQVMDAIRSLPSNYRVALIFHYYDGLKAKEIASIMDVSESAAKSYLHRGRAALKYRLEANYSKGKMASMSMILPLIFQKTDLLVASKHSIQVLEAAGIATATAGATGVAAGMAGMAGFAGVKGAGIASAALIKTIGGIAMGGALVAIATVGVSNALPKSGQPPAESQLISATSISQQSGFYSSSEKLKPKAGDGAAVPSDIKNIKAKDNSYDDEIIGTVRGAAIMGQIYFDGPGNIEGECPWNVPGITVELFSGGRKIDSTITLAGENSGWYVFGNLKPGTYEVKPVLPSHIKAVDKQGTSLLDGCIAKDGRSDYLLKSKEIKVVNLPVLQTGSIRGSVKAAQEAVQGSLEGIQVEFTDDKNVLLAKTTTTADGSYVFEYPPVGSPGSFNIKFQVPGHLGVALDEKQLSLSYIPGANMVLKDVYVNDISPPSLEVLIPGDTKYPDSLGKRSFVINVWDAGEVRVHWVLTDGDEKVAEGDGQEPNDALDALNPGEYVLQVTAADRVGNLSKSQRMIRLD